MPTYTAKLVLDVSAHLPSELQFRRHCARWVGRGGMKVGRWQLDQLGVIPDVPAGKLLLHLSTVGNPDHGQYAPVTEPECHIVTSLAYQDAAVAVPLAQMRTQLKSNLESMERMAKLPRPGGQANPFPQYVVGLTLRHVEVLAGSGQLDGARELAVQALKIDNSDSTRQRLRTALERAGQTGLAGELAGPP